MANLHSERQFFCEAALCTMHAAALSAEYICKLFLKILIAIEIY